MVGHGGSSAGSYLADPTSPIPSHCASIVATSTVRVMLLKLLLLGLPPRKSPILEIRHSVWSWCYHRLLVCHSTVKPPTIVIRHCSKDGQRTPYIISMIQAFLYFCTHVKPSVIGKNRTTTLPPGDFRCWVGNTTFTDKSQCVEKLGHLHVNTGSLDWKSKKWVLCWISKYFWFKYDLGQKYYAPQVQSKWDLEIMTVHFMSLRCLL